ncbi:MAG: hypothetical protein QNJ94_04320 [Alphaproteobacteria bacterium]|nr:hypothetical protein [Alphaproteobacteria bacterium]
MRTPTSVIVFAIAASIALPAAAAEIESILKGSTVHRSGRDGGDTRYDIWRLAPDGTLTGNFRVRRPATRTYYVIEGDVNGRWSVQNDNLCVEAKGLEGYLIEGNGVERICFEVRKGGFGRNEYVATDTTNGKNWQVFVYPGRNG